jgi:ATP adenylyltransferase
VRAASTSDCFFCDYARSPRRDAKNLVVARGRTCFLVMNRYPYTGGHVMAAPLAHKGDLGLLDDAERRELLDLAVDAQKALRRSLKPHGFNLGINLGRPAGAGVPGHLHLHVVPRWTGDTNFMTAVADVRVDSDSLEKLHRSLQKALPRRR